MGIAKNLVLGGSGTIGSGLCRYLESRGESVTNLDIKAGFDLRTQPLDSYSDADYVWFLAWDVGGSKFLTNPAHQHRILNNNIQICSNVFSFLEKHGLPFMFISSQLAAPDNSYGITKLLGERWTEILHGSVVRLWNVYGWEEPGEKAHVITDMVLQALSNSNIKLLTNGMEERQFIYIDDCVENLYRIRQSAGASITHLTNGKWIKIKDVAQIVADAFKVNLELSSGQGYQNKIDPDNTFREYTWNTSLDNGLNKVIDQAKKYLLTNPA